MTWFRTPKQRNWRLISLCFLALAGCASLAPTQHGLSVLQATPLLTNSLTGDTAPVRDPSIVFQSGTYYLFSTDSVSPSSGEYLPIRCSTDKSSWRPCGQVFTKLPAWVSTALPGIANLWAPDISFFNGVYHLYYSASRIGSQSSVIGFATNATLDPSDPAYRWKDRGELLQSRAGDDFNAIDPNILVDADQKVWLTYGSFWSGIKQREIDPATGRLLTSNPVRYELAARPQTPDHAVEGASLVHHGAFYYLFLSVDHCCASSVSNDDYKQMVGRSSSPNGPFFDAKGTALLQGGGSILLEGNSEWKAPGGGSMYLDSQTGEFIMVFHALNMAQNANAALWVKTISWNNDWPVLN